MYSLHRNKYKALKKKPLEVSLCASESNLPS